MTFFVPGVDLAVALIATLTVLILRDLARLAPSGRLRRAWQILAAMLGCCIIMLFVHAAFATTRPRFGDIVGEGIFLMGVCFIYAVTWLARRTAGDVLRAETIARDAFRDALTGIGNRRHFTASLDAAISDARLFGRRLSVIVLDIDHFKHVNDSHGHAAGDEVLRRVAGSLAGHTRSLDVVCRIGGEEFAVIVHDLEQATAWLLAERLRQSVADLRIQFETAALEVTISLGFAVFDAAQDGAELLKRADAALYAAKRQGRNRLAIAA